jgi:hypothetical protein
MYIPKIRNAAAIAEYYKKHDSETAVTMYLIKTLADKKKLTCRYIGQARLFNLDECLQYFSVEKKFTKAKKIKGSQRKTRGTFEILNIFKEYDSDTFLSKRIIRGVAANEKKVFSFFLPTNKWMIDLDQFITFFSGKTNQSATDIPRIRTYEESYHIIHRDYPQSSVTWNELHSIVHSGEIFIIKHGNRWILNYDQLIEIITKI